MIEFGYAVKRARLLSRTIDQLIRRVEELNQANKKLRTENEQLFNQLKLRARWDADNLPDDQQKIH